MNFPLTLAKDRALSQTMPVAAQLRFFLALSRMPHCLLDLAAPVLAALLCLGGFPPPGVALLALFTALAGYTAVYAVNDLVDYRTDQANQAEFAAIGGYLDGAFMRHPLAQGVLTMGQAVAWTAGWGVAALAGALLLNPVCALLLLAGVSLEILYCLLLKVSHLRALINGVVKTLGGLAAVLAVNHNPPPLFLAVLFLALFSWEIGGQNIPADFFDLELDKRQGARTLPLILGRGRAAALACICLAASSALVAALFLVSPAAIPLSLAIAALVLGGWLLLWPAADLLRRQDKDRACALFNRASYFPLALLGLLLFWLWLPV